jgi:hypothetical protein
MGNLLKGNKMRTKKNETWLLNIANHIINDLGITYQRIAHCPTPEGCYSSTMSLLWPVLEKMTVSTIAEIVFRAIGDSSYSTVYRKVTVQEIWKGSWNPLKVQCGMCLLRDPATIVLSGVIYEIIMTEWWITNVQNGSFLASSSPYTPTMAMIGFVRSNRIKSPLE